MTDHAQRPGYREYAALSIVEQAVKDMAGIGGDISGVTCEKMKKLIQTVKPCTRCGGSGLLETVECPNCDNGLVKSTEFPAQSSLRDKADYKIGEWLSAALEDPNVCAEMKADIRAWFEAHQPGLISDISDRTAP